MSDSIPFWVRASGLLGATGIRAWMSTLDYHVLFHDPSVDGIYPATRPRIYVFWHEYILMPLYLRGNCNLTMLLSKHRDADILYRLAYHMGFKCVRGSTYGGATEALLELSRLGKHMHMAITPDGPRGPRRKLAQGAVFLASRLQLPIVPMGMGVDRPWRTPTWDKFALPRPGSRARAVVGPEIFIPPGLDRPQLELQRQGVERLLNELTGEAEQWAESGERRVGSVPVFRQGLLLEGDESGLPAGGLQVAGGESTAALLGDVSVERRAAG
ncbi:MAG: lysophospholipid acyltransferase family protein [Pirellulales bacterium]|nr:lysophospholipid acyltransferase family protein [Pirellulales bacterium]